MLLLSLTSANVLEGLFIRSRGGNQEAGVFEAPDPRKKGTRKADSRDRGRDLTRTSSSLTRERALQMARDGSEEAERQRRRAAEGEATTMESEESQHRKREAQDGPAFADRLGETAIVRRPADENEKGGRRDCIPEEDDDRLRRQHRPHRSRRPKLSPYTPYVAASSVCLLCIGAALQVIAQFFGVLALTLNASPVPDDISNDTNGAFGANSWVIGVALSTYATVAWTTALITAGLVILTYRLPRIEKLL